MRRKPLSIFCICANGLSLLALAAALLVARPSGAAPGDILFSDGFESGSLAPNWNVSGSGSAGVGTQTSSSGSRSLFTRWDSVTVTSRIVNAAVPAAQLSMWVRRGSDTFSEYPDSGENFVVEYLNSSASWAALETFTGGGAAGEIFSRVYTLPANALHTGLRIRVRQTNGSGSDFDYWHVDNVEVQEVAPPAPLAGLCDDFESGLGNWTVVGAGDAGTSTQTANSPTRSLFLRWDAVTVTSDPVDFSSIAPGKISTIDLWVRRGADSFSEDTDNNEDLVVEYLNSSASWVALETFSGGGTNGEIMTRSWPLPADAEHAGFRLRFRMTAGSGPDFDYWHVDDACVNIRDPAPPLAYYAMDETSWNGTAGEVRDGSGNGHHGTALGSANTVDPGRVCLGGNIPRNDSAGQIDAINTGIDVDSEIGNAGTINLWYQSSAPWQQNRDRQIFDASTTVGDKYFFLSVYDRGRVHFGLEDTSDGDFTVETSRFSFGPNTWVHLAATWNLSTNRLEIYVNGTLVNSASISSNGNLGNMGNLYLGDNSSTYFTGASTPNSAHGVIDEVRVYNRVLTATEIQADMNASHTCGSGLNHFQILHDGAGIHCLVESVTVRAIDSGGNLVTGYNELVTLTTQTGRGTWSSDPGNAGTFTDATADDGLASYDFDPADGGEATFFLYYPAGTATFDMDVFETGDPSLRDDDSEGNITFGPSGFTVTASALPNPPPNPINDPIGTQTAGTVFNLHLAAYGQTPTDPTCGIIESYTGGKTVQFWSSYVDPGSGTIPVQINPGSGLTSIGTAEASATALSVTFTAGQAQVQAKYKDVGRIQISMKDTSVSEPATGIRGATNPFVVRPATFAILTVTRPDGSANPGITLPPGEVFVPAGTPFRVTLEVRDSEGSRTPNYGNESTPEGIRLEVASLVAPTGGQNGAIGNNTAFSGTGTPGEFQGTTFHWSEVGALTLRSRVEDGSYLNAGDVVGTSTGTVGRFIPDHFSVTSLSTPEFATQCSPGSFTYAGEGIPYTAGLEPQVVVEARNAQDGPTENYTNSLPEDFFRLTPSSLTGLAYSAANGTLLTTTPALPNVQETDLGEGTITFNTGPEIAFDRGAAPVPPFDADVRMEFNAIDEDGVTATGNPIAFGQATPGNGISFSAGKQQRWGRIVLSNAYGSERVDLPVPLQVEYYDGTAFVLNTDDSDSMCTAAVIGALNWTPNPPSLSTMPTMNANFTSGDAGLELSAPDQEGTVDLDYDLGPGGANQTFLQYDWNGLGSHDQNPSSTATFGIFKGDDEVIYLRERF